VVHHYHLPKWLRDNDFLVKGHRPPMNSYWKCFKSVFRVHTETGNIWTHLLGMNVDRIHVNDTIVITFCVSCRRRKMYIGNARLYLCVCLCVCLSLAAFPHYCTDPDVTWGNGSGCPVVVQCWADLQSVHRFCFYDNVVPNTKCWLHMVQLKLLPSHHYHTQWTAQGSVFGAVSLWFLSVYEISPKPLNGFAPNSRGRRVWSLRRVWRSRSPGTKKLHFSAILAVCVQFMLGKTSVASSFMLH